MDVRLVLLWRHQTHIHGGFTAHLRCSPSGMAKLPVRPTDNSKKRAASGLRGRLVAVW